MSAISGPDPLAAAGLPPINEALLPASVRNGTPAAKSAYTTALGFEDLLVNQLCKEMMASADTSADTSADSSADSSTNGTDGSAGSAVGGAYSELLPQALSSGIMSAGGLGLAQQIATSLDPSFGALAPNAPAAATPGVATPGAAASPAGAATSPARAAPSSGGAAL